MGFEWFVFEWGNLWRWLGIVVLGGFLLVDDVGCSLSLECYGKVRVCYFKLSGIVMWVGVF